MFDHIDLWEMNDDSQLYLYTCAVCVVIKTTRKPASTLYSTPVGIRTRSARMTCMVS